VIPPRNRIRLSTVCSNQRGEEVLSGEAWVMPSPTAVRYERAIARPARAAVLLLQPWLWAGQTLMLWSALSASLFALKLGGGQRLPPSKPPHSREV